MLALSDPHIDWLNFIRTGDPHSGPPLWPRLTLAKPDIIELGAPSHARPILPKDKLEAETQFLDQGRQAVLVQASGSGARGIILT